jgi:2-polyprenyl-6-methoxyphenol hydroxylase-like FAD-dependent oxidoreductase
VLTLPNVTSLQGHAVSALLLDRQEQAVNGVRVVEAKAGNRTYDVGAGLVVDASGRGSRTPSWLSELGYGPVEQTTVSASYGYAGRLYRIPPDLRVDWSAIYIEPRPPANGRFGATFTIEGGRWIVGLGGANGDFPPADEAGFLAYAASLRSPVLSEAIREAEPLSPIAATRSTANQCRHYERLHRWPGSFLVVGDAMSALNPIYGQGMSVAAKAASVLDTELRRSAVAALTGRRARALQRRLAECGSVAWTMSTSADLRYTAARNVRRRLLGSLQRRYLNRVVETAMDNPIVHDAFLDVMSLLMPPATLFRPRILTKVARGPQFAPLTGPPTIT